ncbi:MAG: hypothetical protein ACTSVI_14930 [Promethearchaeota archaeon]
MESQEKTVNKRTLMGKLNQELKICMVYILGYAILYLPSQVIDFKFQVSYYLSELDMQVSFDFAMDDVLDILLPGVLFSLVLWKVFEMSCQMMPDGLAFPEKEHSSGDERHSQDSGRNVRELKFLKYLMVTLIVLYNIGNGVHVISNHLNKIALRYSRDFSDPLYSQLYNEIYFWDEIFGHLLMAIPLFLILLVYLIGIVNHVATSSKKIKPYWWVFVILSAIGFGLEWFYGWAEGQCLLVSSILEMILLITIVYMASTRNKKITGYLKKHPFITFMFIQAMFFISATVAWGFVIGIKAQYPFFYQPGEEIWSGGWWIYLE